MCTVTFVPGLPGGGYLLATNRDESPARVAALPPSVRPMDERLVLSPRDPEGGGTWIGADDDGATITLLNGDRPAAALAPEDPVSRGRLVLELLEDPRPASVRASLAARERDGALRTRPFKLVVAATGRHAPGATRAAHLLRADWDGATLAFSEPEGPRCIVSSTYEPDRVAATRRSAFDAFLARVLPATLGAVPSADSRSLGSAAVDALADELASFHAAHRPEAPDGDAECVCMHRDDARTVSSTLVSVGPEEVTMRYQAGWPCEDGPVEVLGIARRNG